MRKLTKKEIESWIASGRHYADGLRTDGEDVYHRCECGRCESCLDHRPEWNAVGIIPDDKKGPGRPPKGDSKRRYGIRLYDSQVEKVKRIGDGSLQSGIDLIIKEAK